MGYGRKRFSIGNIIGDPFALATISIAFVSLLVASVLTDYADIGPF